MNRILIAVAAAVFAVSAMLTPSAPAQAGFKGRLAVGLALGAVALSHQHYKHQRLKKKRYHARRKAKRKVYTSKKSTPKVKKVAKAKPAPLPEPKVVDALVENENSSISTAALAPIEETASIDKSEPTPEPVDVVAEAPETEPATGQETARKLDCKKFFPSVGMTLSVSCE